MTGTGSGVGMGGGSGGESSVTGMESDVGVGAAVEES